MTRAALWLTFSVAVLSPIGCEGSASVEELCTVSCTCAGCDLNARSACERQSADARTVAIRADCEHLIDDLITCMHDNATCQSGELQTEIDDACRGESFRLQDEGCGCFTMGGEPPRLIECP